MKFTASSSSFMDAAPLLFSGMMLLLYTVFAGHKIFLTKVLPQVGRERSSHDNAESYPHAAYLWRGVVRLGRGSCEVFKPAGFQATALQLQKRFPECSLQFSF